MTEPSKSLMQIESEALEIQKAILAADGEVSPDLEKYLDEIEGQLENKALGYSIVLEQLGAFGEYLKDRADQYAAKAKTVANIRESMKDRIKMAMLNLEKKKIAGGDFSITLAKAADSLNVDLDQLPEAYIKQKVVESADRDLIKKHLELGTKIAGVEVMPNFSLRISISSDLKQRYVEAKK